MPISPRVLRYCSRVASSRRNFASHLVRQLFSLQEMMTSNCTGSKGKGQLDPRRLLGVREAVFDKWPNKAGENEQNVWNRECIIAIDEACRRLNRSVKF